MKTKRKVLLINPFPHYAKGINEATIYPPVGLAYIASMLEKFRHECEILDANILRMRNDEILNFISSHDPDIIGVYSNIVTVKSSLELLRSIKENFKDKITVCGGPIPTVDPHRFLNQSDIVVRGEGEYRMLKIVDGEKLEKIDGISFRHEEKFIDNTSYGFISDLDSLPFPAYHLLPKLKLYRMRARKMPVAPLVTSRGCPYSCIYCTKSIFGRTFRSRSPKNVMEEIDYLINAFGIKQIDILDDNFSLDVKRAEKICDMIIDSKYDIVINCQNGLRVDRLTKSLIQKLKRAGVFKVGIGIESGNEKILNVIKKQINLKQVENAIKWFKEIGIIVYGFFMIGLPGDNTKTMSDTINFAKRVNPDVANFMITVPVPGTELYDMVLKEGKFIQNINYGSEYGFYGGNVFFEMRKMKPGNVLIFYKKAYREFYLNPMKILELISKCKSSSEIGWFVNAIFSLSKGVVGR